MNYSPDFENWKDIFERINSVISRLENFRGAGLNYCPSPQDIAQAIDELQEIRLLIPTGEYQENQPPSDR